MNQYLSNFLFFKKFNSCINFIKKFKENKLFIVDDFYKKIKFKKFVVKEESSKNFNTIKNIINYMIKKKYNKNTLIISIGGGVAGDISGMISSIYYRGLKYINIPTTLLSQVDSSIGGKNGVNSCISKNMIGTIYLPYLVIICFDVLYTLNKSNIIDGFAEIIKISIINNKKLFYYIKNNNYNFKKIIYYSLKSKISIIKNNFLDSYKRLYLNLGHTFGHAIEKIFDYKISHGKSIYMGMLLSLYFSYILGFIKINKFKLIKNLIIKYFKNYIHYFSIIEKRKIFKNIIFDKKNHNDILQIIMIKNVGSVFIFKTKIENLIKIFNFKNFIKRIS